MKMILYWYAFDKRSDVFISICPKNILIKNPVPGSIISLRPEMVMKM